MSIVTIPHPTHAPGRQLLTDRAMILQQEHMLVNEHEQPFEHTATGRHLQLSITTTHGSQLRREESPTARPSQKARTAAAAAGAIRQATLGRYTTIDSRPQDNGWGERARRQPSEQRQENEGEPSTVPLN